jgi:hypothetical protein
MYTPDYIEAKDALGKARYKRIIFKNQETCILQKNHIMAIIAPSLLSADFLHLKRL